MLPELDNASLKEPEICQIEAQMKTGFSKYLENYYLNWQLKNGRASIREFSRWLDINHAQVIQWMNGRGKPGYKNIVKLAQKLGPEVYEILEINPSDIIEMTNLPPDLQRRLISAISQSRSVLTSRGLSGSDPEAEDIVIRIFEEHGFKYRRIIRS